MASLVADYGSNSEDSESTSESDEPCEEKSKSNNAVKLPGPGFMNVKNSVFVNPFVEEENAKKAILEKHVKMTPTKDQITTINGKRICWNFRKGKCRFGHNCKYAHDSDIQRPDNGPEDNGITDEIMCSSNQNAPVAAAAAETQQSETSTVSVTKKKRPGLSQTLIPSKKVMKLYKKHSQNNI